MNEILWAVTRAAGLVSIVLLTVSVIIGALTAGRAAPIAAPTFVRTSVHRTLALLMTCFVVLHVITAVAETYVDIGWLSVLVPFSSAYDTFWVGLGTLALDLMLAVTITSLLRSRLPLRAWRAVHLAAYALWPIALLHGIGTATTDGLLVLIVTLACAAAGAAAIIWRVVASRTVDADRRQLATASGWR